ncbi:cardiolipin synthase [Ectobacillus antri]|jgi:cardiolipin synthase|uniref:Cardiolipin synthase n=1 Tax=Ectobacillus antri TaxID=2486280 RepID=A0ABT6H3M7_9BACI|nr:cardiolipin synthase [Ectobacillus antri]MDG4656647.1 cardiolipin synthase [Ectobacillus antri]MDG5753990.1 cardiolipin synthase [Ectobacillus antri]
MKKIVKLVFLFIILFVLFVIVQHEKALNIYIENISLFGIFSTLFTISGVLIGFVIFLENRQPSKTLTWLIVLGIFPVIGFFAYLLFGQNFRRKRIFARKGLLDEQAFSRYKESMQERDAYLESHKEQSVLLQLAERIGTSHVSFRTETTVLTNGAETFAAILETLEQAEHHIHMEYYIVRHDGIGTQIKELLIKKARQGVQVRFLYDAVGSFRLSKKYIKDMTDAGIEMVPFFPVRVPILNDKINYRNHRKIIVVDGNEGFIGGLNIGDEYLGKNEYFGFWRDTHLYLKGEAVQSLQLIFLQDWFYMTGETLVNPIYMSAERLPRKDGGVQLIAGGPDSKWETIKHLYFAMITSAKESIWLATPYFIPDDDILSALKIAALAGLDVRLLMPAKPDKRTVFYASRSYFPELLEAGVRIYEYEKGFLHSKIVIVDKSIASIGTANMDMRSFHLNFEVNAFLYGTESIQKLVTDFETDLTVSRNIHITRFQNRRFVMRIVESAYRLLSPLL